MSNTDLIYLGSPYYHEDREVRAERAHKVSVLAAKLINRGINIFCPIAHSYCIVESCPELVISHEQWLVLDKAILKHCKELWIYELEGWMQSKGIAEELEFAKELGLKVSYVKEEGNEIIVYNHCLEGMY